MRTARLLDVRICDLDLRLEGTFVGKCIRQVREELARREIRFNPYFWVSTEWFTPDGYTGTAVPFYLLHSRLIRLERSRVGIVEAWQDAAKQSPYLPFFAMISPAADYVTFTTGDPVPAGEMDFCSRLLFMLRMHKAYPGTGTVCTGAAAKIPGTIVQDLARPGAREQARTRIGHPAGVITVDAGVEMTPDGPRLVQAALGRTARRLLEGYVFVPWSTFA